MAVAANMSGRRKARRFEPRRGGVLTGLKPSPIRPTYELMLCDLIDKPFEGPDWLFEPKLDGLRVLCRRDRNGVKLISRNDKSQNFQFPDVVEAAEKVLNQDAVLDGEIVCFDESGRSSFRALQQRFHLLDAATVALRAREHPAYLCVFDILYYDRFHVTELPLEKRKKILKAAFRPTDRIRIVEGTIGDGAVRLREACRRQEEGIIAKRMGSRYLPGRGGGWYKIKCLGRQEFVIGGFTDPQRSRVGLGALLVGYYDEAGKNLIYAGKVGTGYTREILLDLRRRLEPLERRKCPFTGEQIPRGVGVHWVKPKLVAEIAFAEWTQNDLLRQPRFEGLREDKKPTAVRRERPKRRDAR